MIDVNIRCAIFWCLDYLSGSPVRRHLHNIQLVSKNESLLAEHQAQQLKSLLNHAVQTTDYYKNYDRSGMLKVFPIINKNIIRESFAQFQSSVFKEKKLRMVETTGSTGTPFRVVQNSNKRKRLLAEVIHANSLIGYQIGARYAWTMAAGSLHREKWIGLFIKNKVELSQYTLDYDTMERHRKALLNDKRIEIVIGYSSVLFDLARHILTQGTLPASFGVKGVLCLSEPLYPQMRETIQKAFNCPVLSRYSNEECGVLAYECPTCHQFHLNSASYFFETLELDRDKPTPLGTTGRIVVTDLYNYALPIIRYDTGDIGAMIPSSCTRFATPILQSLEGRRVDTLFDTSGRRVMMFSFDFIFEKLGRLGKVNQFQLIQEGRDTYRLRICANNPLSDEIDGDVKKRLKAILGTDAQLDIEYTSEIPILSSGKRKYIVNNYHPGNEGITVSNIL